PFAHIGGQYRVAAIPENDRLFRPNCMLPLLHSFYPLLISCPLLVITACSSTSEAPQPLPSSSVEQRDLSGYWEKNYQRSDDFSNRFNLYAADIRRLQMN